ncbi:ATP-binding protein [Candidatus Margulisiibacteriota bacterium]
MVLLKLYSLANLITAIICFALMLIALRINPARSLNKVFALWVFFVGSWSLGILHHTLTIDYSDSWHITKVLHMEAIMVTPLFLHLIMIFVNRIQQRILLLNYFVAVFLLVSNFSNLFIKEISAIGPFVYFPKAGTLFFLLIFQYIFCILYAYLLLYSIYKKADSRNKMQIKYLIAGTLIGYLGGASTFLYVYDVPIFPYANYFTFVFPLIIAYAVYKHQILDIALVIRKGLIYSVLIAVLSCFYTLGVFLFGLASISRSNSLWFSLLAIVILTIVFKPLQEYIQRVIDKIFFRHKYDYQQTLKDISEKLRTVIMLDDLVNLLLKTVPKTIKIETASFYKNNEIEKSPLKDWFLENRRVYIKEELKAESSKHSQLKVESSKLKVEEVPAVSVPLFAGDKLIGIFNLGEKLSEESYSTEDIQLLTTIANQAALALENIEANRKLVESERMATLGKVAAGLAHEIKNPIAAMNTLTQLMPLRKNDDEYLDKLYNTNTRQLKRMNDLVMNLLKLGKPIKLNKTAVDLNELLDKVVELIKPQCEAQNIKLTTNHQPLTTTIKADREQLFQVFLNLTQNAIQSMPKGGELIIETTKTQHPEPSTHLATISDTGAGISKDQLAHIFEPFFTTKAQGTGLGLPIVKKILDEHGFGINVESEEGKGTEFRVAFSI